MVDINVQTAPHEYVRNGWRFWLCRYCYAPRRLHPRRKWVYSRPMHDNTYYSADAPNFNEGW